MFMFLERTPGSSTALVLDALLPPLCRPSPGWGRVGAEVSGVVMKCISGETRHHRFVLRPVSSPALGSPGIWKLSPAAAQAGGGPEARQVLSHSSNSVSGTSCPHPWAPPLPEPAPAQLQPHLHVVGGLRSRCVPTQGQRQPSLLAAGGSRTPGHPPQVTSHRGRGGPRLPA